MKRSHRRGLSSLDGARHDLEPAEGSKDEHGRSWFDTLTTSDLALTTLGPVRE
jgi:hypothetical protein